MPWPSCTRKEFMGTFISISSFRCTYVGCTYNLFCWWSIPAPNQFASPWSSASLLTGRLPVLFQSKSNETPYDHYLFRLCGGLFNFCVVCGLFGEDPKCNRRAMTVYHSLVFLVPTYTYFEYISCV